MTNCDPHEKPPANGGDPALEPDCRQIELVKFTKTGGPLTKQISLSPTARW